MRVFSISPVGVTETTELPSQLPAQGHVWIACTRQEFETLRQQARQSKPAFYAKLVGARKLTPISGR